jgi:cob(I)alamin adenosyltransferase
MVGYVRELWRDAEESAAITKADWAFRAEMLDDMAQYLERKADGLRDEAARYRGLAEQARTLVRLEERKLLSMPHT